jgi:hypothetical protein
MPDGGDGVVMATDQQRPASIVLDATHVYWINETDGNAQGAIMRMDRSGGAPTVLVPASATRALSASSRARV